MAFKLNPLLKAGFDYYLDPTTAWGAITGTLSNQTDLQTALDGKFPYRQTLTFTRTSGLITQVVKGSRTIDITRTAAGGITSWTDGVKTWTVSKDTNGRISAVTVT